MVLLSDSKIPLAKHAPKVYFSEGFAVAECRCGWRVMGQLDDEEFGEAFFEHSTKKS